MIISNFLRISVACLAICINGSSLNASNTNVPPLLNTDDVSTISRRSDFSIISIGDGMKGEVRKEEKWDPSYAPPRLTKGVTLRKAGENYNELRRQYLLLRALFILQRKGSQEDFVLLSPPSPDRLLLPPPLPEREEKEDIPL